MDNAKKIYIDWIMITLLKTHKKVMENDSLKHKYIYHPLRRMRSSGIIIVFIIKI